MATHATAVADAMVADSTVAFKGLACSEWAVALRFEVPSVLGTCQHKVVVRHSPYFAWLSKRRGAAVTPRSLASLDVKLWSECLDSYDSMKRTAEKSELSSSFSFAEGIPPAQSHAQ